MQCDVKQFICILAVVCFSVFGDISVYVIYKPVLRTAAIVQMEIIIPARTLDRFFSGFT